MGPCCPGLAAKTAPSNIYAQFYWGQALFKQQKYEETVGPYERLLELDKTSKKLDETQRRIVTDQAFPFPVKK
jgi:cytochrome c-type biogenesis protein CcmH/NrfG